MTYEEAIKRIKDWNLGHAAIEVLSTFIPELKESEDERTRKELLSLFEDGMYGRSHRYTGSDCERYIAWLEKQKTTEEALRYLKENHSPSEVSDFQAAMNIAVAKAYNKGYTDGLEKQGVQKFVDKCKNCNNVKGCITCIDGDQYAHITEQKPSTSVTEFDTEVERFCKECFITDADEKGKVFCIARHFADWQKNRKNPAWSEEDKENISMLIDLVESKEESMEVKIELSAWLKSLKDRIQPQSKQEWNEEDEERYVSCLQRLGTGNLKQPETINTVWLKSLKERVQLV